MDNFLLRIRKYEKGYKFILRVLAVFITIVLFSALLGMIWVIVSVILYPETGADFMGYIGYMDKKDKPEFIKLVGLGISGIIAIFGVVGLLWRASSLDEQNELTEKGHIHERVKLDEQNKQAEKGHIHERFNAATEHLGDKESASVRIASFNEFYRLAEITAKMTEEKGLKETIFYILCAHLRHTTKNEDYKNNLKPTEEVQNLLDILFKPKDEYILIFSGLKANLAEAHLQGVDLQKANLQDAKMQGVNLQDADLEGANLQGTHLRRQYRKEEYTKMVDMQQANLQGANLLAAQINRETTVMPDNWEEVVKLYDNEEGQKRPMVVVMNSKGEVEGRY